MQASIMAVYLRLREAGAKSAMSGAPRRVAVWIGLTSRADSLCPWFNRLNAAERGLCQKAPSGRWSFYPECRRTSTAVLAAKDQHPRSCGMAVLIASILIAGLCGLRGRPGRCLAWNGRAAKPQEQGSLVVVS